jgi:predicted small secreted protein
MHERRNAGLVAGCVTELVLVVQAVTADCNFMRGV